MESALKKLKPPPGVIYGGPVSADDPLFTKGPRINGTPITELLKGSPDMAADVAEIKKDLAAKEATKSHEGPGPKQK